MMKASREGLALEVSGSLFRWKFRLPGSVWTLASGAVKTLIVFDSG